MSLDNQPKSPLNMNYLLEALFSPREARHILDSLQDPSREHDSTG